MASMQHFRARQLARIRDAVAAGRQALHDGLSYEPLAFARAFVAAGGVQIPGGTERAAADALGERLIAALGRADPHGPDRNLRREIARARTEARWAEAQRDDTIVGFYLVLPESALESPTGEALSHENHGLGPGVFRKADIVVLQPECDGARWIPVSVHEVES